MNKPMKLAQAKKKLQGSFVKEVNKKLKMLSVAKSQPKRKLPREKITTIGKLSLSIKSPITHLKGCNKRALWNLDIPVLAHFGFTFFLLLKELLLTGNIPAITFSRHVLTQR